MPAGNMHKSSSGKNSRILTLTAAALAAVFFITSLLVSGVTAQKHTVVALENRKGGLSKYQIAAPVLTTTPSATPTSTVEPTAIPTETLEATVTLTSTPEPTVTPTITPTLTPTIECTGCLPIVIGAPNWRQTDVEDIRTGARSLAICRTDTSIRYLGTDEGLFQWSESDDDPLKYVWKQIVAGNDIPVPPQVRQIVFGESCEDVFIAALDSGVWMTNDGSDWEQLEPQDAALESSRTVIWRNDVVYAGTDTGIYTYRLKMQEPKWDKVTDGIISRMSIAGNRIYAAVWMTGVTYNDLCSRQNCDWNDIPAPDGDGFVRDVLGEAPIGDEAPSWLLLATASTVYHFDGTGWFRPEVDHAPQPEGNVFSLGMLNLTSSSREPTRIHLAGVEEGGVWATYDRGFTWKKVGALDATVRDIAVPGASERWEIFAATFDSGVWRMP